MFITFLDDYLDAAVAAAAAAVAISTARPAQMSPYSPLRLCGLAADHTGDRRFWY